MQLGCHLDSVQMQQHKAVSLVQRLFSHLSQVLSYNLVLFRSILELSQLFGMTDQLNDIFEFHVLVDFLNI